MDAGIISRLCGLQDFSIQSQAKEKAEEGTPALVDVVFERVTNPCMVFSTYLLMKI